MNRPIVMLTLANIWLRCSSNVNLKSDMTPNCFWEKVSGTLLLKIKGVQFSFFDIRLKLTSSTGIVQSILFFKSLTSFEKTFTSWTVKYKSVSSAKSFAFKTKLINHLYKLRIVMDLQPYAKTMGKIVQIKSPQAKH